MSNPFYTFILTILLSVAGLQSVSADNDHNTGSTTSTYYIDAPRFVRPLVEKWIAEYQKVQPAVNFAIAKSAATRSESTLHVRLNANSHSNHENGQNTIYFARYAILPVTTKDSYAAKVLSRDELNDKKLKRLFFQGDEPEETNKKNKPFDDLVIYSGSAAQSVSQDFASYFGQDASAFRGKRIIGDDQFLNNAIARDPKGVTINALSNLYDLKTRQLKSGLELLPLSVDKSLQAALGDHATLDQLIGQLEISGSKDIPVEAVGLSFSDDSTVARDFADWVVAHGQAYNHAYGLLNLNEK